jgi:hypothetical protein
MAHDDDFRFIPIEAFADMSSYQGAAGRDKLAREARFLRQLNERTIAERVARGEIYTPEYVIDYAENEPFWRAHFARVRRPSAVDRTAEPPEPSGQPGSEPWSAAASRLRDQGRAVLSALLAGTKAAPRK